jgi:hypothetical protein
MQVLSSSETGIVELMTKETSERTPRVRAQRAEVGCKSHKDRHAVEWQRRKSRRKPNVLVLIRILFGRRDKKHPKSQPLSHTSWMKSKPYT